MHFYHKEWTTYFYSSFEFQINKPYKEAINLALKNTA